MSDQGPIRRALAAPWAWAATVACAVLLAGVVLIWAPFLGDAREYVASTPAPAPSTPDAFTPVTLPGGGELCMTPVTFSPDGRIVTFRTVEPLERPGPPVSVRLTAAGYAADARLPDGFTGELISFEVEPPSRSVGRGSVCLRNEGRRALSLVGSTEVFTASARPVSTIDGTPIEPKVALSFYSDAHDGLAGHLGDVLDHAAAFKPFGPVMLGLAALLLLIALPLATVGALVWAMRRD